MLRETAIAVNILCGPVILVGLALRNGCLDTSARNVDHLIVESGGHSMHSDRNLGSGPPHVADRVVNVNKVIDPLIVCLACKIFFAVGFTTNDIKLAAKEGSSSHPGSLIRH